MNDLFIMLVVFVIFYVLTNFFHTRLSAANNKTEDLSRIRFNNYTLFKLKIAKFFFLFGFVFYAILLLIKICANI